jgi:hypothetical protein
MLQCNQSSWNTKVNQEVDFWAVGVAQEVECLFSQHKTMSSNLNTAKNNNNK